MQTAKKSQKPWFTACGSLRQVHALKLNAVYADSQKITQTVTTWFEVYLSTRQQCVAVGNQLSDLLPVSSGVPQGSILGPLLFPVDVNDVLSAVKFFILFIFVDDTKWRKSISRNSDSSFLLKDLSAICTWSSNWILTFNDSKCTLLSIRGKNFSASSETYVKEGLGDHLT